MLPFDRKPWAKAVAKAVVVLSILFVAAAAMYLHTEGPLDTPEILIGALLLLAIIPPNLAIIMRKHGAEPRANHGGILSPRP